MEVFALRHKPTGEWMPARMYRTSRGGWSYWEPGSLDNRPHDGNPRIFFSLVSARNALTAWLRGEIDEEVHYTVDWQGPGERKNLVTKLCPQRTRESIEIVSLSLTENPPQVGTQPASSSTSLEPQP